MVVFDRAGAAFRLSGTRMGYGDLRRLKRLLPGIETE